MRAPSNLGPAIREVVAAVGAHPGVSAYALLRVLPSTRSARCTYGAIARAVRGGWVRREAGKLFPANVGKIGEPECLHSPCE